MPEFDRGAFLVDRDAALGDALGETAQVIQRMDAAGTGIEHPADKAPRSRLFAHLMGIEDTNFRIAHLTLHPFGFVDRGPQRRIVVCGLDLPAACQPRARDTEFGDQFLDHLDGVMRDLVHAPGHGAAMGGVDVAEREPEFGGDDTAIAAARAPAGMIGFEHDRRKAALRDMMRGRQPGIARADDDDIGLSPRRQASERQATAPPYPPRARRPVPLGSRPLPCQPPCPSQLPTAASANAFIVAKWKSGFVSSGTSGVPPKPFMPWRRSIQQTL